jgi:hypothetical protein
VRISLSVGTLELTSPVACHIPSGGLELRKLLRRDDVRVRLPVLEGAEVLAGERWTSGAPSPFCSLASDCMGVSEGNGSAFSDMALAY